MAQARIPAEERLFGLVLALLATGQGLNRRQILSSVYGYANRFRQEGLSPALERLFERDKDDVRDLGIPLETIDDPAQPGNTQTQRYRIPKGAYDLPRDVRFTPHELSLLSLASRAWQEGSLSGESRRALTKLRSLGVEPEDQLIGFAPRLRPRDVAFDPLTVALEKQSVVAFDYLRPGDAAARERIVEPLALVLFRSRWYLRAFDRGVKAERTFLLSRITSPVRSLHENFTPKGDGHALKTLDELQQLWDTSKAVVEVLPGSDAQTRLAHQHDGKADATVLQLHYSDLALFADELAGYGPEVLVRQPLELRRAVLVRLRHTVRNHAEARKIVTAPSFPKKDPLARKSGDTGNAPGTEEAP